MAWVLGGRDSATFGRLYDKVKHLKNCLFYTDNWGAFAEVLPPERHIVGKAHTIDIEHDNSNTRHHLARFTRRTKVVSQAEYMVDLSLRIWQALTTTDLFSCLQKTMLYFSQQSPISNVVAGALDRISVIIQRVAMGDLTAHFVVESKDEIGVMAVRLEKMVVQIWEFINRVNQSISVVAGAAAELSASADGMSSSIEQISHSAQTQKSTSEKIVAAMAELSASVDEACLRAQGSLAQLDAALQRNSTGELAGDALDEITQATARIAEAIGVIQETAHRANLLIRNVSFGAARADEHGRWVVSAAEEARKLTERSAASAKEIVRHNIELLDSAERGGETVNTTVELLRNIKDGLDQLTTRKNYSESSAKKEKGSAKETTIETATTQISATTGNVTHAATELAHLASELQAEIRQFKLTNKVD